MNSRTQVIMTEDSLVNKKQAVFKKGKIDIPTRVIHFGIMVLALAAYVTGDGADDYKKAEYSGYTLHMWLGMGVSIFILFRIAYGLIGPKSARFSSWVPYTKERLRLASEGVMSLFFLEPGQRAGGLIHFVEEIHEVGETLVPLYLVIHVGAVIIHALYGRDIWRKMFFMKKRKS